MVDGTSWSGSPTSHRSSRPMCSSNRSLTVGVGWGNRVLKARFDCRHSAIMSEAATTMAASGPITGSVAVIWITGG